MVTQHYRWDFIGLSSYDKPTPETSEKVVDGSTYYEADTSKLYIFYKDTWYEKTATGGGGGGGIKTLTTADYNYPVNNPTYINLGLFDPGIYFVDDNARIYDGVNIYNNRSSHTFVVTNGDGDSTIRNITVIYPAATPSSSEYKIRFFYTFTTNPYPWSARGNILSADYITNNLTTNNANRVLSAAQGKVLKDLIDNLEVRVAALEG